MNWEPFASHPNLSDEVNSNIIESEILGGADLNEWHDNNKMLHVITRNTHYRIKKYGAKYLIQGNAKYCPLDRVCRINGSTWGGSMLKMDYIGIGMQMEFVPMEGPTEGDGARGHRITTSIVEQVYETDVDED